MPNPSGTRRERRVVTGAIVFPVAAAIALLALRAGGRISFAPADGLAGAILVVVIGLGVVSLAWAGLLDRRSGPTTDQRLREAADLLAPTVKEQWHKEARLRGLLDESGRPQIAPLDWTVLRAPDAGPPNGAAHSDYVHGVVAFYSNLRAGRLTIVGPPGSGKSALVVLMTLALLDSREAGSATPVLLSAASWSDAPAGLDKWLAGRLAQDYAVDPATARRLVEAGLVLPVLDGLDELPADVRRSAIAEIGRSPLRLPGLILTCRTEEYESAESGPTWLRGTAVVALRRVPPQDAIRFLATTAHPSHRRLWEPVFARLSSEPNGPLAEVLTQPLSLSLAQVIYGDAVSDPLEMLAVPDLRTHLERAFISTAFARSEELTSRRWDPARAYRWLIHLAELMAPGSRDFAWWRLSRTVRPATAALAGTTAALITGATVGLGVAGLFGVTSGLISGTSYGLLMGVLCATSTPPPSTVRIKIRFRVRGVAASLAIAATAALLAGSAGGAAFGTAIGLSLGLLLVVLFSLTGPRRDYRAPSPRSLLRADRTVALVYGVVYGATTGIAGWAVGGAPFGIAFGILSGLAGGLIYGPAWALVWQTDRVGVIAWLHFLFARIVLAAKGRLPWRTMTFLEDAYRLGVLRQVGGVYQFRHASLQDVLLSDRYRQG